MCNCLYSLWTSSKSLYANIVDKPLLCIHAEVLILVGDLVVVISLFGSGYHCGHITEFEL